MPVVIQKWAIFGWTTIQDYPQRRKLSPTYIYTQTKISRVESQSRGCIDESPWRYHERLHGVRESISQWRCGDNIADVFRRTQNCLFQKRQPSEVEGQSLRFGKASLDPAETTSVWTLTSYGDWAYEIGRFTASAPDGSVLNVGKYIVIWKRQATGEWKTHRDIFNWDIPPAQASVA
jgi:hypothetical protein